MKSGLLMLLTLSIMSGCTTYQARPLNEVITLPKTLDQLKSPSKLQTSTQANLDVYQVAAIALLNNPDLNAKREQLHVSEAQLINAKLFADPQLSASFDQPTTSSGGAVSAWGVGLNYGVMSILTHNAQVKSAQYQTQQAKLELQWQEWQVVQQARVLFLKSVSEQQQLTLLASSLELYQERYQRSEKALEQGNTTLETVSADLTSLVGLTSQTNQLAQQHSETQQALSELMGLDSRVVIQLTPAPLFALSKEKQIEQALLNLSNIRPDLLALKAGYESQEMKVHQAVLSQFPAINIGFNHASDAGALVTNGFSVSINLPIFNGNKGVIAQQRATRNQLRLEYQNRLNQAANEVHKLIAKSHALLTQLTSLNLYLPKLQALVNQAKPAFESGELNALVYISLENSWIQKKLEKLNVEQQLSINEVAIDSLLAIPFKNTTQDAKK